MFRKFLVVAMIASALLLGLVGIAFAANPHPPGGTGQPGKTCGDPGATSTPGGGNSGNSPGSPFTGGVSDGKYNAAESQYDVACFQVTP